MKEWEITLSVLVWDDPEVLADIEAELRKAVERWPYSSSLPSIEVKETM